MKDFAKEIGADKAALDAIEGTEICKRRDGGKMMTPKEKIKAVIHFKRPDVLPWCENFYDETILAWFKESLLTDKSTIPKFKLGVLRENYRYTELLMLRLTQTL